MGSYVFLPLQLHKLSETDFFPKEARMGLGRQEALLGDSPVWGLLEQCLSSLGRWVGFCVHEVHHVVTGSRKVILLPPLMVTRLVSSRGHKRWPGNLQSADKTNLDTQIVQVNCQQLAASHPRSHCPCKRVARS